MRSPLDDAKWRGRAAGFWLLILSAVVVAGAVRSLGESDRVAEQITRSDQRWCRTLTLLVAAADDNPPSSQYGKDQLQAFKDLRVDFKCDTKGGP